MSWLGSITFFWIFPILLAAEPSVDRPLFSRIKVLTGMEGIFASNFKGYEIQAGGFYNYAKKNTISFQYSREARQFTEGSFLFDDRMTIGHVLSFSLLPSYVLSEGSWCPNADFTSQWKLFLEPHWIWKENDLSIGIQYSAYKAAKDVRALKAAYYRLFHEKYSFDQRIFITLSPSFTASSFSRLGISWTPRFTTHFSGSFGQEDLGQGIIDSFVQGGAGVNYRFFVFILLRISGSYYYGDLRNEKRVGASLEYSF